MATIIVPKHTIQALRHQGQVYMNVKDLALWLRKAEAENRKPGHAVAAAHAFALMASEVERED